MYARIEIIRHQPILFLKWLRVIGYDGSRSGRGNSMGHCRHLGRTSSKNGGLQRRRRRGYESGHLNRREKLRGATGFKASAMNDINRLTCMAYLLAIIVLPAGAARAGGPLLYVASFGNDSVQRYDPQTGEFVDIYVNQVPLDGPEGIGFGPDGAFYIASRKTNSVMRYHPDTGKFLGIFVPTGSGGLSFPHGLLFGPDQNLYVASNATAQVLRYDGRTGAFMDVFAATGDTGGAIALVFGPDGHLYLSTSNRNSVLRFHGQTGEFIDMFVPPGSGGLDKATGLTFGSDGNLYVNSNQGDSVLRYDGQTGEFIDVFVSEGSGGLNGPSIGLAFGPNGDLFVGSGVTHKVLRYNGQTGAFFDVFVPHLPLEIPTDIMFHTIVSVPAASTWGIAVMTLLLLTAATILILQGRRLRTMRA